MLKYRVEFYESDSWSSDTWFVDYDTEEKAKAAYQECFDMYMGKDKTPDYYVKPTYIGVVDAKK